MLRASSCAEAMEGAVTKPDVYGSGPVCAKSNSGKVSESVGWVQYVPGGVRYT